MNDAWLREMQMNATITIVIEDFAELEASASFCGPNLPTRIHYDPRLAPWFAHDWTTLSEFEDTMRRASIALNGRVARAYEGLSVEWARWR